MTVGLLGEPLRDRFDLEQHRLDRDDRHQVAGVLAGPIAAALRDLRENVPCDRRSGRSPRYVTGAMTAAWLCVRRLTWVRPSQEAEAEGGEQEQSEDGALHPLIRSRGGAPCREQYTLAIPSRSLADGRATAGF